jgi:adenosylcobinamide-GDP ribazoletransferase
LSALFLRAIRTAEAARFAPLVGASIGAVGGAAYWLGAQIWPANVAVILSMAATALLTMRFGNLEPATRMNVLSWIFCLLIKYNALMSLSAAKLPFVVPANLALGVIMICGHAASFALAVSVLASRPEKAAARIANGSLIIALLLGFAPAVLLGIPGLIGLAGAIIVGLSSIAVLKIKRAGASGDAVNVIQWLTEACFYLGVLAARGFA